MIVFGLNFFQANQELQRLLATLPDYHIIAVDGRENGYPSNNPLSTDGSRVTLQKYDVTGKLPAQILDIMKSIGW